MSAWWEALRFDIQLFYLVAFAATLALGIQVLLMFLGFGDHDAGGGAVDGHDAGHGGGAESGHVPFLSVRTLTGFLLGFGWAGVIALKAGWPVAGACGAGVAAGTGIMAMVYGLLRGLTGLRSSGTLDYRNAIGQVGTVYVTVPKAGSGQVEVLVQGRLQVVHAVTHGGGDLKTGSKVRVTGQLDAQTVVVEPLAAGAA